MVAYAQTEEERRQAIEEMVARIVRRFSPERIILFGSHEIVRAHV